jgi:MOSC domain-containing protein YiiM
MADGWIYQLNTSRGGVPKLPVEVAKVDQRGIAGDLHGEPVPRHGGPDKALCLLALEVIEAWAAAGHPIQPGSTGENITTRGLDWPQVVPGARLRLGDHVLIEVTSYANPCKKNAQWFADGNFARLSQKAFPGRSRVYARVLHGGALAPGDPIAFAADPAAGLT